MKARHVLIAVGLAGTIGAITFVLRAGGTPIQPHWQTAKVARADIQSAVTATGSVQPVVTSPVGAQVSGIVWRLHADFNSHVVAGQILVELEPALFRNAVLQADASLNSALANVAKARAQLADAVRTRDRSRSLAGKNFLAQAEADTAQANVETGEAALQAMQATVLQARAQLDRARLDLSHSVVHSPVTGTVISRNVDVGQAVASSFTAPTLFLIAEDLSKMHVHTNVDEADIGQIHVGQKAEFTVDTFRGRKFPAQVAQIRNAAQTLANVVTYDVVMEVDNTDLLLRPGMTANVAIVCAARQKVLAVPTGALRFRPLSAGDVRVKTTSGGGTLWVPDGSGLRKVPVQLGITDGTLTEVSGIPEGEDVVVDALKEGPAAPKPAIGGTGRGF